MSKVPFEKPVEDTVPKINDEIAVGEDLEFQRRWWKFEKTIWVLFGAILIADLAGIFGRGPVAHAEVRNSSMALKYERIERAGTPAILQVQFAPGVAQGGKVKLFVSGGLVKELGNQRVVPAPESSAVGGGGITYTFAAGDGPAEVEFALQPAKMGVYYFTLQAPGADGLTERVVVMP